LVKAVHEIKVMLWLWRAATVLKEKEVHGFWESRQPANFCKACFPDKASSTCKSRYTWFPLKIFISKASYLENRRLGGLKFQASLGKKLARPPSIPTSWARCHTPILTATGKAHRRKLKTLFKN
jgi:hypothetical protein